MQVHTYIHMVRPLLLTLPLSLVSTIKAILPLGPTTLPSHKGAIVEAATASRAALATPRATRTKIMTAQVGVQVRACPRDQQSHVRI